MVKFGKEYRQLQLEEWKKYYLDYKGLKHKIRLMKRVLVQEIKVKDRTSRPSLQATPLLPEEIASNEEASGIYKDKKGEHLKEFIELLIKEFKKSYDFFTNIEKVLIKKVNAHLYTQTSYSAYTLAELTKEMKSLSLTIYLVKSLNGFINDIMMAVKKILKKFDKNFSHLYGLLTPHIILKLLSRDKSELEYLLQFKLIDEISIIVESSASELKRYFDQNNEIASAENEKYRTEFLSKYFDTLKYIKDIDELIYFKTQHKDWVDYITKRKIKKSSKHLENDIFNPILTAPYYRDNLLDKFLSTNEAFNEIKSMQKTISVENKRNIILILAQTFFYNSLVTCIFPVLYYYEKARGIEKGNDFFFTMNVLMFLAVGATYLGQWLSIFFFYNYISIKEVRFSYLFCYTFICIGSLIYIASILYGQGRYKPRGLILGLARLLIGLGSNPMIGKKYLTFYTPKYLSPVISRIYLILELSGLILGPCITALFCLIHIGSRFCILNCIGYYGVIGSFVLFLINYFYFTPPGNEDFSMVINQTNDDVNMSSSQAINSHFDDFDDTQDIEFYRLQKERNQRKKEGLEPTKSDDVHIEVNDTENNKSVNAINNTASNVDFKGEKDDEDTAYNKIIEKAGEELGQNEIVGNYYNNVDTGRYSDVDVSNEQRDTIKEIEDKLFAYQEKSNFTYINMIPRTLEDIILTEQKTFGYMNRNFIIILSLLFFNNLIRENLIMYTSYYILFVVYKDGELINRLILAIDSDLPFYAIDSVQEKKSNFQIICLYISIELLLQIVSFFFIMPFYKVNLIFKKNLIIFMIASIVFMIPLSIIDHPIGAYLPIATIDIFIHKVIEVVCCCYLVYLIPPQWKYAHIRASSLPIYLMNLGKIFACTICFICYKHEKKVFKYNMYLLNSIAIIVYGIIGIVIYKSNNFRVKALARVLRKRAVE